MNLDLRNKKVFIALSGGRDSAVAALLLREKGAEVKGVFFKLWQDSPKKHLLQRAEERAKKLGIPLLVWDFSQPFKKYIVDSFIQQYKNGFTPNPCIECNYWLKFGLFLQKAKKEGADFIATGHYVRKMMISKNQWILKKALDKEKDQSYFLWRINKKILDHVIFPLGNKRFSEVKGIAQKNRLIKKDYQSSQEICFISGLLKDFLRKYIRSNKGEIILLKEKKFLGYHQGICFYTIGQRSGLNLPGGPWYVVKKDIKRNILYVSREERDLFKKVVRLKKVNVFKDFRRALLVRAKLRYRQASARAYLKRNNAGYYLEFIKAQRAPASGQSAVFYRGDCLIGGGIIK